MAWKFEQGMLWVTVDADETEYAVLCEQVEVVRKLVSLIDGTEKVEIHIVKPYPTQPFCTDRGGIARRNLMPLLTDHGLSVDSEDDGTIAAIKRVLNETELTAPIAFVHNKTGFREVHGKKVFLCWHPIGDLDLKLLTATHEDAETFRPAGSATEWCRYINTAVSGSAALQMALSLSVTAPVSCVLKEAGVFTDLPLFSLIGISSSGKTTLLYLMASLWGNPKRIVSSFLATSNALAAMLQEAGGMPYLADEATYTPNFDWDALLYTLPTGRDKRRCNPDGTLKKAVDYSGALILSSERSIFARSKGFEGQHVRLMEFTEAWFGEDDPGAKAEAMRECILRNYGHAGTEIIKHLMKPTVQKILIKRFLKCCTELNSVTGAADGQQRRFLQRIALILCSAWLITKALPIELDIPAIQTLLLCYFDRSFKSPEKIDSVEVLYQTICDFSAENQSLFPTAAYLKSESAHGYGNVLGMIEMKNDKKLLHISQAKLEQILRERTNYSSAKEVIKPLHERGYLRKYYDDRFLISIKLGNIVVKGYTLILPPTPETPTIGPPKKKPKRNK